MKTKPHQYEKNTLTKERHKIPRQAGPGLQKKLLTGSKKKTTSRKKRWKQTRTKRHTTRPGKREGGGGAVVRDSSRYVGIPRTVEKRRNEYMKECGRKMGVSRNVDFSNHVRRGRGGVTQCPNKKNTDSPLQKNAHQKREICDRKGVQRREKGGRIMCGTGGTDGKEAK